jgi:MOSC domain-containing protein YiiM
MAIAKEEKSFTGLFDNFRQSGEVVWIGTRSQSGKPMQVLSEVNANIGGLTGDRSNKGDADSKRQVTIVQWEHLNAVASYIGRENIDPALVRRNIVVKGINLLALKNAKFSIGAAVLEMTGNCFPCNRMEETLGEGGFNAMRGHGGITCRVVLAGSIRLGDKVTFYKSVQTI